MPMPDNVFMEWIRGRSADTSILTERDILGARDISIVQLWLYTLVLSSSAKNIVEIGVADGSTSIPLLKGAEEVGGIVHSVDPSVCEEAKALVSRCAYDTLWVFHRETSDDFFAHYNDTIDLALIDGDHRCSAVTNDVENVLTRLSPGGFIVLHDWNPNSLQILKQMQEDFPDDDTVCGVVRALASGVLSRFLPLYVLPILPELFNWRRNLPRRRGTEGGSLVIHKPPSEAVECTYWKELGLWGGDQGVLTVKE